MNDRVRLTGYAYSVYTRTVRIALQAKGLAYEYDEVDPFDEQHIDRLAHPFGRVPVFDHGGFRLYETQAILDYIEAIWPDPPLVPEGAKPSARMRQVMGIADSYVYGPLVRQVVSQALFAAKEGVAPDADIIAQGMVTAPATLAALDDIAQEGMVLNDTKLGLAECHLWPMIDYFRAVPEGAAALAGFPALTRWANHMASHSIARLTAPDLQGYSS